MNNYTLHRLFTVASISLSREPSVDVALSRLHRCGCIVEILQCSVSLVHRKLGGFGYCKHNNLFLSAQSAMEVAAVSPRVLIHLHKKL